jgi:sortase B
MRLERTKNRKKNKIRYAVIVICLAVFAYSAWHLGGNYWRAYKSQRAAEEQQKKIEQQLEEERKRREEEEKRAAEEAAKNQEDNTDGQGEENAEPEPFVLDFTELTSLNSDIMGWLVVDGTNINYPVLFSNDDRDFYLTHNYLGEYDPQGAVYIENFNHKDMSDFDTIVYGHSMLNGNMFGTLHSFSNWDFFQNYGTVTFYTPSATYHYQVFETATIGDKHILTYLDNSSTESINDYLALISGYESAFIKPGYNVTADNRILTLSTCTTDDTQRLVVFAVLVDVT